ncbi:MAG: hypothetical protein IT258_07070 [Saprospiraceae bacterium]|nr:hypothetical protein [Saprospiraceae bacterium]
MKKFFFLLSFLTAFMASNSLFANTGDPIDGKSTVQAKVPTMEDIIMQKLLSSDKLVFKKDTTIKINGKGGLDGNAGKLCPEQASSECATIWLKGAMVVNPGDNLYPQGSKADVVIGRQTTEVTVLALNNVSQTGEDTFVTEGRNVMLKAN